MKDQRFASELLRASLSGIAEQLQKTKSARGRRIRKEHAGGYDLEWAPDPHDEMGLSKVTFINVDLELWRELGSILERIAKGENARRLFGQHLRTNPAKDGEHRLRALAYWSVRARDPEADDAPALDQARRIFPALRHLTPATLRKYAQRHRARCLVLLSLHPNWKLCFESSDIEIPAMGLDLLTLINHLRKKEDRAKWRKPPFESIADALFVTPKGKQERQPAFPGLTLHAEELPQGVPFHLEGRDAILETIHVTYPADEHRE